MLRRLERCVFKNHDTHDPEHRFPRRPQPSHRSPHRSSPPLPEQPGSCWIHYTLRLPDFAARRIRHSLETRDLAEARKRGVGGTSFWPQDDSGMDHREIPDQRRNVAWLVAISCRPLLADSGRQSCSARRSATSAFFWRSGRAGKSFFPRPGEAGRPLRHVEKPERTCPTKRDWRQPLFTDRRGRGGRDAIREGHGTSRR